MCSKAVDACIPELKLVPDWFGTNKILDKFDDVVFIKIIWALMV